MRKVWYARPLAYVLAYVPTYTIQIFRRDSSHLRRSLGSGTRVGMPATVCLLIRAWARRPAFARCVVQYCATVEL